ncbi:hypothetical protein I314_03238 [Cryptococcus bacillisporus CA1873]|uniref:Uncharacterized protein n=1 Tax=Cryptococcus bacillisporus CA1873 TaxID=1296111 RepID=A0ABR5BBZ0_CRYGA|nr:hypothetical protein I314_03238 [Cryptococcus bacillisporus CA1873]|eukprot:KIR63832.1 hypothetical protein I314_03238 [Cryptococcus gattii CA1873]
MRPKNETILRAQKPLDDQEMMNITHLSRSTSSKTGEAGKNEGGSDES